MANATCKTCGSIFVQPSGRGRPRAYCDGCRRVDTRRRPHTPVSRIQHCVVCGAVTEGVKLKKYCSATCKRVVLPYLACTVCGGPTGWTLRASVDVTTIRCRACTRSPNYRVKNKRARGYVDRWTCTECGAACERPAMKGQRPKYCATCRRVRRNPLIALPHSTRLSIYERDGWKCGLCSADVDRALIGSHSPWRPSLDHIIPRSLGGSHDPSNLRLAHWWCNTVRGAGRTDDLFQEARRD